MRTRWLLALALGLVACNTEQAVDTDPGSDSSSGSDAGTDAPRPNNDDIANATEVTFDDQGIAVISEAIEVAGDRDFFHVSAVGGNYYVFTAFSDVADGGTPDTVCRIYDADGNLIATNDDMPRRRFETDCSILTFATQNTDLYVEVLEWSDWDADTAAEGGASWTYQFVAQGLPIVETNEDDAALGTDNDDIASATVALNDGEPDYWSDPWEQTSLYQFGAIDSAGDVDIFGISFEDTVDSPFEPQVCQWSTYPGVPSALTPRMRLLDAFGTELAVTEDTDMLPVYNFLWDAGITYPISLPGDYFIEVTDVLGTGGPDHWYAIESVVCYPAVYDDGTNPPVVQFSFDEESASADPTVATEVALRAYSTAYSGGSFVGSLESTSDLDSFMLMNELATGQVLTVFVEDVAAGSTLTDAKVTLWDNTGAELASANGPNAELTYTLTSGSPLYVSVESASGNADPSAFYLGSVLLEQP